MGSSQRWPPGQRVPTALVPTGVVTLVREHPRSRGMPGAGMSAPAARSVRLPRQRARRAGQALGAATMVLALGGCGWVSGMFADDGPPSDEVPVLDVTVGQCFAGQEKIEEQVAALTAVPCDSPHRQESYAIVDYVPPTGVEGDAFPGDATLANFADAKCAQDFEDYVGISYLDSSLFFTYLMPSARGWEESDDRAVICFVTTTGDELTASAKESRA